MIRYHNSGIQFLLRLVQRNGSVFPTSLFIALPCACVAVILKFLTQQESTKHLFTWIDSKYSVLQDNSAWNGFSVLVGFLIIFRTSQAYNRFWEGCTASHRMRVEWFNLCSQLIAYCKASKAKPQAVAQFRSLLTTLFSILHAVAIADISDTNHESEADVEAFGFEVLGALDPLSLRAIRQSDSKTELLFQWIQQLVVDGVDKGIVAAPAPMVGAAMTRGSAGMTAFYDAIRISSVPFPFPYAQVCDCLLVMHWLIVPFTVTAWSTTPYWSGTFTFVQVFILWSLNFIAVEIENPFGMDANDIDAKNMHVEANKHLAVLIAEECLAMPATASDAGPTCLAEEWERLARASISMQEKPPEKRFFKLYGRAARLTARLKLAGLHGKQRSSDDSDDWHGESATATSHCDVEAYLPPHRDLEAYLPPHCDVEAGLPPVTCELSTLAVSATVDGDLPAVDASDPAGRSEAGHVSVGSSPDRGGVSRVQLSAGTPGHAGTGMERSDDRPRSESPSRDGELNCECRARGLGCGGPGCQGDSAGSRRQRPDVDHTYAWSPGGGGPRPGRSPTGRPFGRPGNGSGHGGQWAMDAFGACLVAKQSGTGLPGRDCSANAGAGMLASARGAAGVEHLGSGGGSLDASFA